MRGKEDASDLGVRRAPKQPGPHLQPWHVSRLQVFPQGWKGAGTPTIFFPWASTLGVQPVTLAGGERDVRPIN
ncbi:hypothetical protein Y1Q_0012046 [Alligator mississippiensis]|uniref:Uncharacterized protein n=1 Tax=Alligator mississippiensis TaxID=8496 RepID=A0A151P5B7_ALLMI|nr:hypothetical protein Y1Q_0012046 [Alligator mississippiensis]